MSSLQQSIQLFLSAPLSSKAYDSAKNYFMVAYTPIGQSIIMTAEAFTNAHKKFVSEYQATVGGEDIDEDKIQAEIDQYQELLHTIDDLIRDAKRPRPDLERRSMNAYEAMQKRKEKLEKLRTYSAQSASFFSEYTSSQQELNNGIAQIKDCKAWNASAGTFDLKKLDMNWAKAIFSRWDERAKKMEKEHAAKFKKAMEGRRHVRVQIAPGVYEWMWVKDPLRVSQADFEFNETYKDYLAILMNPKENGILDDYFATMAEELRTGINAKTGKTLTDLEKAQRWSTVLSAISVVAIDAYYGGKGLTSNNKNTPKKTSGTNPTKTDFGAENPVSGKDWNNYFKDKYGSGNVNWKPNSLEDIISNPERLYGSIKNEIKSILGEGWTEASYGSAGTGWKFTNDGDGMVFYHPGDGIHGGSYYRFSTGDTGKVKIVGEDYIDFSNDKATFIKFVGE